MTALSNVVPFDSNGTSPTEPRLVSSLARRLLSSRVASILLLLIAVYAIFTVTLDRFFTYNNQMLMLVDMSRLLVVSIGMTFVLLVGGFDLSVGYLLAFLGFVLAWFFNSLAFPIVPAILATIVVGAALGAVLNGFPIGRLNLSFMVVTLGTMTLFQGLVKLVSKNTTVPIRSAFLVDTLSFGKVAGIPVPVIAAGVVAVIAGYVMRFTLFGRDIYSVGGNAKAAGLSGINVARTIMAAYAIAGATAAIGGTISAARTGSAGPTVGDQIMLQAAAAVLVGGTSLRGGSGTVLGTVIGVGFFGVLSNGLQMAGFDTEWQQIISGVIIAGAALADKVQRDGWRSLQLRLPRRRARP